MSERKKTEVDEFLGIERPLDVSDLIDGGGYEACLHCGNEIEWPGTRMPLFGPDGKVLPDSAFNYPCPPLNYHKPDCPNWKATQYEIDKRKRLMI